MSWKLKKMRYYLLLICVLLLCCSKSSNPAIDPNEYRCGDNKFSLSTNFREFCSIYSEYGAVLSSKVNSKNMYQFWYTFADEPLQPFDYQYKFSFACNAVFKGVGNYEFSPPQSKNRTEVPNSAWIEVHYDKQKQIPWSFNFITPQKIKFTIEKLSDEQISGTIEIIVNDQLTFKGSFKNLGINEI